MIFSTNAQIDARLPDSLVGLWRLVSATNICASAEKNDATNFTRN